MLDSKKIEPLRARCQLYQNKNIISIMSADRNPGIKPRRKRTSDVVVGETSYKEGVKGNIMTTRLIYFEPPKDLVVTPEMLADLESLVKKTRRRKKSQQRA